MFTCTGQGGQRQQRGQAGPLGFILVFALVIAATTLIVVLGASSIGGTQETLDEERTEKALTQLDSQAALVALGNSDVQRIDLSTGRESTYRVEDDAGRMTLSYTNQTTETETVVFSERMGRIVYESKSGSTIAYQGGGVWRAEGINSSAMISPPEFHYRDATLTLPLVTIGSSGTIGDRAVISNPNTTRYFPNTARNSSYKNPLENARVEVSVTSEYYRAWGRYFETRTDGEVEFDHADNRVTLALVTPLENTKVSSATASLSASGTFEISGKAGNHCGESVYTNSYDSSGTDKDYCDQESDNTTRNGGDIVYGGDVTVGKGAGGSDIRGDVISGGVVSIGQRKNEDGASGKPYIHGNISFSDKCEKSEEACEYSASGAVEQISGIDSAPAINGIVRTQVNATRSTNDNGATDSVTGNTLNYTSGSVELGPGNYYLTEIDVDGGDTVTLNTTEGDIYLGVEENVDLGPNAEIEVIGDGTAGVYVLGDGTNANQLEMASGSSITNPGDDAPQFRIYGREDFDATIGGGSTPLAKFVGVIYAPPGTSGTGTVSLEKGVVYGGILTGTTTIETQGSIHYDEALRAKKVLTQSDSIVRVTYIHASTNEIQVEDG